MRFSKVLAAAAALGTSALFSLPGLATTNSSLEVQFPEAVNSHLVRHHAHLYNINENEDGSLSVQVVMNPADGWTEMDNQHPQIVDLLADTAHVDGFGLFKEDVYMAARNTAGVSQIWKMCKNCRPATWELSGEAGFGDESNSQTLDLFAARGGLYALTVSESGNRMYKTTDGDEWTQVGVDGLGFVLSDAVGVAKNLADEIDYFYLGTTSGAVYRATVEDPSTWSLVTTLGGEITALFDSYIGVTADGVATVWDTEDGSTYTQVGEAGLGNTNNSAVTGFSRIGDHWFAETANATDGAEIRRWSTTDGAWDLVTEAGFGDADNTQITNLIRYRNHRFASTVNTQDGVGIYKLTHLK